MITERKGNIFTSWCQTLVNPVNCVGVSGAGLAKQFAERYPTYQKLYVDACRARQMRPGGIYWVGTASVLLVAYFATKDHWKNPSQLEWVEQGLSAFVDEYEGVGCTSVAFPLLGAGLGGLQRDDVLACMKKYLEDLPIPVEIWEL